MSAPPGAGGNGRDGGGAVEDGGTPMSDGAVAPPPAPAHVMGNLLTFTFDDYDPGRGLRDRSGRAWHGDRGRADFVDGVFGKALHIDRAVVPFVLDSPDLFSQQLTIEAWVQMKVSAGDGRLFGDGTNGIEYQLVVEGGAVAWVIGDSETAVCSTLVPPDDQWMHVAVTWDGSKALFYRDGQLACTIALSVTPAEVPDNAFMVGRAPAWIDELKVSDYVKTSEQIQASMNFDTTQVIDVCGDRFVLFGVSSCEPEALCCTDSCVPETSGQACSDDEGQQGTCQADGLCEPVESAGRVTDSLVALYHFDSIAADSIPDESDFGEPANLIIKNSDNVQQMDGFVRITSEAALIGDSPSKVIDALINSDAMTVEAWVRSSDEPSTDLPRRIVSIAADNNAANFTLGQAGSAYVARLRGLVLQNAVGMPAIASGPGEAEQGDLDHVVVTFADDVLRLYVNGRLIESAPRAGLESWDPTYHLVIANEIDASENLINRAWIGDLHLIAIYQRALSPIDVSVHYRLGPNP